MKSFLVFLAVCVAPAVALAQMPAAAASPADQAKTPAASASPAALPAPPPADVAPTPPPSTGGPPATGTTPAAGNAHDAAATVPLPGQSTGPALEKNLPLMPDNVPGAPEHNGRPGKSGKSGKGGGSSPGASPHGPEGTFAVEQDIRVRLKMRDAQTRALNDPHIQADWDAAHHTKTDPERRALLTVYYNHLYDLMIKIDPSIADRTNARRSGVLARMKYTRLEGDDDQSATDIGNSATSTGVNPPGASGFGQ
jgi:hypothetical protein